MKQQVGALLLLVALSGCDREEAAPAAPVAQAQGSPVPPQATDVTTSRAAPPAAPTRPEGQRKVVLHVTGMMKSKGDAT